MSRAASARVLLLAAAAALAAASSSDDPNGGPCLAGMVRLPGPACTLPPVAAISVDGDHSDWKDENLFKVLVPSSCCRAGDSGITHAGVQLGDGQLIFFSTTVGPPITDGTVVYGLAFRRVDLADGEPGGVSTVFLARADGSVEQYLNDQRVFGAQLEAAFGAQGIEWRIARTALPYPGAAYVVGTTYEQAGDGTFKVRNASQTSAILCWDPSALDQDLCRLP